jgi:hypothetical protein
LLYICCLDIPLAEKRKITKVNQRKLGGAIMQDELPNHKGTGASGRGTPPAFPISGNIEGLCITMDFTDEPGTILMGEFNDCCNKLTYNNYGNNSSLYTFYSDSLAAC